MKKEGIAAKKILSIPGSLLDAQALVRFGRKYRSECFILDGYHFRNRYQQYLRNAGIKFLIIDDNGGIGKYSASLILDQNICADRRNYENRNKDSKLMLGTKYALLRKEFLKYRKKTHAKNRNIRVLITLGGGDPNNETQRVLKALAAVRNISIILLIGALNKNLEGLKQYISESGVKADIKYGVSDVAEIMRKTDIAISAAGSTSWELAYFGIPSLLVSIADNQVPIMQSMQKKGCALALGRAKFLTKKKIVDYAEKLLNNEKLRERISKRCRHLVDGKGARRVVDEILRVC